MNKTKRCFIWLACSFLLLACSSTTIAPTLAPAPAPAATEPVTTEQPEPAATAAAPVQPTQEPRPPAVLAPTSTSKPAPLPLPPTPVPPTPASPPPAQLTLSADMEADTDRPGMDYKDFDLAAPDPALCKSACLAEPDCLAYTYVKPGVQGVQAHCWLKSGAPPAAPNTCCISGVKAIQVAKVMFNDYPSAVAYLEGGQPRIYAFAKGSDGRLYVNYWNGKWQWADQGTSPGANAGNLGNVIAYLEGNSPRIYAFAASGSHLYVHYWDGSKWQWADQGAPASDAIGGPGVVTYREEGKQRIYAFARGSDSHLHVNYWDGARWQWADQGQPVNAGVLSVSSVITYREANAQRIYAFVIGSDNRLYVNYWNGSKWQWAEQGAP